MRSATAEWYERAARELAGTSALQVGWARGIAGDDAVLALVDRLPREHRQPSLLFSVAGLLGAPAGAYPAWREWLVANWSAVEAEAAVRRTQTNEPGRVAPLVAALDRIGGPIALLEVGAAAGLCLIPDRYGIRYGDGPVLGHGRPVLRCRVSGAERAPERIPEIVWRAGIDLAPLSVDDPADVRWLEALLPPDRPDRLERLRAAVATARRDPPVVVAGDALAGLARVAADAPPEAVLVVASLGTLVYLPPADRGAFPAAVRDLGGRLVTLEGAGVLPVVAERLRGLEAPEPTGFVLAIDETPVAHVAPHGDALSWLAPAGRGGNPAPPA